MYTSTTALLVLTAFIAPTLVVVAAPVYDPVTIGKPAATFIHARDLAYVDELLGLAARSRDGFPATSEPRPMNIVPPSLQRHLGQRERREGERDVPGARMLPPYYLRGRLLGKTLTRRP